MMNDHTHERGNVLFIILIGVALFGALSFAVSNMMRGGSGTGNIVSEEKAALYAGEILDYARGVRQAVQDLRISNGCGESDISFENSVETGYANGSNTECQVFHSDGGSLQWVSPHADFNDGSEWIFAGTNVVDGVGSSAPDLVMILRNINAQICSELNEISGISVLGSDAGIDFTKFQGSYAATQTLDSANNISGGCLNHDNSGTDEPFFYQVIVTR